MVSIERKIGLLTVSLIFIIVAAVITLNAVLFQRELTEEVLEVQLPSKMSEILSQIDNTLLEPSRGIKIASHGPIFENWVKSGESNDELETIYSLLEHVIATYPEMRSANFISDKTGQYTQVAFGERDHSYIVTEENDPWYYAFRDSGVPVNIVVYVEDPLWGTRAFINTGVFFDNKFVGMFSVSIDTIDFADQLARLKLGESGTTFLVDETGYIRLHSDPKLVNKKLLDIYPDMASAWEETIQNDETHKSVKKDDVNILVQTAKIPVLNWYAVTTVDRDEVLSEANNITRITIGISFVLFIIGSAIGIFSARTLAKPIREAALYAEAVAEGNLNAVLNVKTNDEIGILADSLRKMIDVLKQKIKISAEHEANALEQIKEVQKAKTQSDLQTESMLKVIDATTKSATDAAHISLALSQASHSLEEETRNVLQGTEIQNDRIIESTEAIEAIRHGFESIVAITEEAVVKEEKTRTIAVEGAKKVQNVLEANQKVNEMSKKMQETMLELENHTQGITNIINTITDIADQTNLLALNAAIEAARAGDAGRGFAVVADEVRKLAEKTVIATNDVSTAITQVQSATKENVTIVEQTHNAVSNATELAQDSGEALASIVELTRENADQVRNISTSIQQLDEQTDAIHQAINALDSITKQAASGMEVSSQTIASLVDQAGKLDEVIKYLQAITLNKN